MLVDSTIDALAATAFVGGGIFAVSFLIGYYHCKNNLDALSDQIIENTINYMIDNGYVKTETNDNGDVEIIKLDE